MPIDIFGYMLMGGGLFVITKQGTPAQTGMTPDDVITGYGEATPPAGWVWPMPVWNGHKPVVSSSYHPDPSDGHRKHNGSDIMYRRTNPNDQRAEYPPGTHFGSKGGSFFIPGEHCPVIAARSGKVWTSGPGPRSIGGRVVIDHGKPYASYYQHLLKIFLKPSDRGSSGETVRAGQIIGYVGWNPDNDGGEQLAHLHFEVWDGRKGKGGAADHIDPEAVLKTAEYLELAKVG